MARELTPTELRELLAVYALDAVEPDERAQLDVYLARTPDARRELDELRETAALLACSDAGKVPESLWDRIEESLGAEPPGLVLPLVVPPTRVSPRGRRGVAAKVAIGIAAASAIAAGVTALFVTDEMTRQEERLDQVAASVAHEGMRHAAQAAAADPQARTLALDARRGRGRATVVTMPGGDSFLMGDDIPRLGPDRTYQLWAVTGDPDAPTMVSAGVLGRSFDVAAFHTPDGTRGFMVTAEPASGVVHTNARPLLEGHFA